jgi:flagellar protein FliL
MAGERSEKNIIEDDPKAGPKKEASAEGAKKKEKGAKPAGKKGKSKLILIIVFVVIVGAGAGAYFTVGKKYISNFVGKKPGVASAATVKKEAVGPILQLEPFVFNLTGSQSSKYAKISLGIEVKDVKAAEETKKMIPVIRDRILIIFGAKTPEVLMDVNQREVLKKEVYASLRGVFKNEEELKAVYITDIIIQ